MANPKLKSDPKPPPADTVEKIPDLGQWETQDLKRLRLMANAKGMTPTQYLLQHVRRDWAKSPLDMTVDD